MRSLASDGKVVISTELDNSKLPGGINQVKGKLGGLNSVVKKLGGAIAAAFSVKVIADFAKECLDLGSDLQEVQNVVDVTFTTMNEQVNEFAKNAAQTAGLSETMAKKYTGTFGAMAKSFKFTEAEAYEMSTALTQLSGDVASFYNLTQDEAYTKLKSVFTGETESLKDLGVVMTQTALDSYALANGFGKTTSQMSEQEKVALRYRFVMDQLSGASGDFLRTSDSWANQTRMLTLQFDQLKATLGQGLINVLTPAVKLLNTLLTQLQGVADAFLSFTNAVFGNAGGGSAVTETISDSYASAADSAESIAESTKETKRTLAGFDELNILNNKNDSSSTSGVGLVSGITSIGGTNVGGDVQDNLSPAIKAIVDKTVQLLEPLRSIDLSPAVESFKGLGKSVWNFGTIVLDALEWVWFNILTPLAEWTVEDAAPAAVNLLASAFDLLSAAVEPVWSGLEILWEDLEPIVKWIEDTAVFALGEFEKQFDKLADVFEENGPEIEAIFENLGTAVNAMWVILEPILSDLKDLWAKVLDYFGDEAALKIQSAIDALKGFSEFLAGVFTGDFKGALNGLIGILNSLISNTLEKINLAIDGINALGFDVPDWVPLIGGKSLGFNIPSITIPQIPQLAQGAVIPPNREFLAVLGDQKHGTNIEAPLSTIQEAVRAELGSTADAIIASAEAIIERQERILAAIDAIEVGDTTIGQAANRYNQEMAIIKGGL